MTDDERAIRTLIDTWMKASMSGDVTTVLSLMADDVIFMVPGRKPFGKAEFAAMSEGTKKVAFAAKSDIQEIRVLGDWAYLRNYLEVTVTPPGGAKPMRRSGYTLSILRKDADGRWRLARDANLLTADTGQPALTDSMALRGEESPKAR
jgi:uncharacterized protein (TIGR02246 family)